MSIKGEANITANSIYMIMCIFGRNEEFLEKLGNYLGTAKQTFLEQPFMSDNWEFEYFGKGSHKMVWAILKSYSEMDIIKVNEYYVDMEEKMKDKPDDFLMNFADRIKMINMLYDILKYQKFTCKIIDKKTYDITFYI